MVSSQIVCLTSKQPDNFIIIDIFTDKGATKTTDQQEVCFGSDTDAVAFEPSETETFSFETIDNNEITLKFVILF